MVPINYSHLCSLIKANSRDNENYQEAWESKGEWGENDQNNHTHRNAIYDSCRIKYKTVFQSVSCLCYHKQTKSANIAVFC